MAFGAIAAVVIACLVPLAHGADYYVDNTGGSDSNDGLSSSNAWQTLTKVNAQTFTAGDRIFFKAGGTYAGAFIPKGSGTSAQPISVGSYGTGNKPVFPGAEADAATVLLRNVSCWTVENLDISNNYTPWGTDQNANVPIVRCGVLVMAEGSSGGQPVVVDGIVLRGLTIRNVKGHNTEEGNNGRGINYWGESDGEIHNLLIENCEITGGMMTAIYGSPDFRGSTSETAKKNWRNSGSQNMIIRNNYIHNVGGFGVFVNNCTNALVEHNTITDVGVNCLRSAQPAWIFSSTGTVIQHNVLAGGRTNQGNDGQGMLTGYITSNSVWQYNLVYNNQGGALGNLANGLYSGVNDNTIYRYNICINNGSVKAKTMHMAGTMTNVQVYNNTFYQNLTKNFELVKPENWNGTPAGAVIKNNIFYVVNNGFTCTASLGASTGFVFDNNCWRGTFTANLDTTTTFTSDPLLTNPGTTTASDYKLLSASPLRDQGVALAGMPSQDYFGTATPVNGTRDMGAHEYIDIPTVLVSTGSLTVAEGGTNTFNVRLNINPESNVTINVARSSGDSDISVQSGAALTFTPANGTTWQQVTLAAAEDADVINSLATIVCADGGGSWLSASVTATEVENDNNSPIVNAGADQTVYLSGSGGGDSTTGASINLDADLDDGSNSTWEDSTGLWNATIDAQVSYVANAGSALSGITSAYEFPGGLLGSGGCSGASLTSLGMQQKPISLEIWFKPDTSASYPTNGQVLWETGGATGFGVFYNNGMVEAAHDGNLGQISADASALASEFIQAVVTYDPLSESNNFKLYLNGAIAATASRTDPTLCAGDGAGLGKRGGSNTGGAGGGDANTQSFDGKIAIFRSYLDRILTAGEVEANYNSVAGSQTTALLQGSVNDPDSESPSVTWSQVSGLPVVFSDPNALTTNVTFSSTGTYVLRLTADDGTSVPSSDEITVTVNSSTGNVVTYNGNGSTSGTLPIDSTQYASGATVTVSGNTGSLAKTGYTFAGWNTAANGSGTAYAPSATFNITSNVTLYAQWTANQYTVTFDSNGGNTPSQTSKQVTYGSTYGPLATVNRSGYTFDGWFTAPSGGIEMTSSTAVAIAADQTFYAQWTAIPVNVVTSTSTLDVPEGGTATFQVKLSQQPAGTTTVSVSRTFGDADLSVQSGSSLSFTTADWNTYQTVTLAAASDVDALDGTATITCSSSDPAFSSAQLTATEADDDSAGVADPFGNGTLITPGAASGGTGAVANLQTDNDTNYTVAKGATMTVNGFGSYAGSINSVYLFVQYSVDSGYTGNNAVKVNGVNTTIVPADRDYGRWAYVELTAGAFGINTSAEIENMSVTFTNNDTGGGDSVFFDCLYVVVNPTSAIPSPPSWSEDFNGTGQANPLVWNYEVGYQRNNELQYYMSGTSNGWQENGNFVIEGRKETMNGYAYTSASIVTTNKYYWKFGRAQIRAQIPAKAGMWPAIWGTGETGQWPHNGEVDIMEYYQDKILANCAVGTTTQWTAQWDSANRTMNSLTPVDSNWRTQWHIWTMQWDDVNVRLYCDNILMNTIPQTWLKNADGYNTSWGPQYPFQSNGMSCWLNLAIGGNGGGDPTATMNSGPQRYLIDYWKIWEGATSNAAPTDLLVDSSTVLEGLPAGTVVANLTAVDADPAEVHRWALVAGTGDTHNSQFTIPEFVSDNTMAGVLKTAAVLNVADGATRSIRVRVTDIEGATCDKVLTVNVLSLGKRVFYNGNGSTAGTVPTDSTQYASGATVTVSGNTGSLAKTGYTFAGWNTAANGSGTAYAPNDTFSITTDVTLFAQWVPGQYTVTFEPNGGNTPSPTTKQVTYGSTYGPLAEISRTGYTFDGWFTAASGGTQVTSGATVTITANQTLYAQWSLIQMSVVASTNAISVPEGSTATFQVKLTHQPAGNTTVSVSRSSGDADLTVPSGSSLSFTTVNWDSYQTVTLAAATDADMLNGTATITCSSSDPSFSSAQVTATESDKDTTLAISSDGNGITTPSGAIIVVKGADTAISATPNTGYDFVNWTVTSGSANLGNADAPATTVSITAPATVQANFTPKTYVVTYNGNGNTTGAAPANDAKIHDVDLVLATNSGGLAKTGFSFGGWNSAADGNGINYTAGGTYSDNAPLVLFAKWLPGADGTWLPTAAGPFDWSDPLNWASGVVASGADRNANFTPNITAPQVVNLDAPQTIGAITFTDSTSSNDLTISGASALTLAVSSGNPVVDVTQSGRTLTISSQISGSRGLRKDGLGKLTLSGENTYAGGTVINGGSLNLGTNADSNLGATTSGLAFTGTGTLTYADGLALHANRTVSLEPSANVSLSNAITVNGVLAGSGSLSVTTADAFIFSNPSNTFSGNLTSRTGGATSYGLDMASIDDGSGAGLINLGNGTTGGTFRWIAPSGAGTTTLVNRQFALSGTTATGTICALGATASDNLIITKNLLISGSGNKKLLLAGTNGGSNAFNGNIADGSGSAISVEKTEGGTWILGGTNSYTGITNLVASATTGRLLFQGASSLSANTTIAFNQNSSNVQSVGFLSDSVGSINAPVDFQRPMTFTGANTTQSMNLFVGNTSNGTGAGSTTESVIGVGDITWNNATQASNTTRTLHLTGANGYALKTGNFVLPNLSTRTVGTTWTNVFNPTTARLIIGGNITMASGNNVNGGIPVLALGGTASGNMVLGTISDAADVGTTNRPLSVTKTGDGDWTLSGNNNYTGTTTVSAGKLFIDGNQSAATGNVSVDNGATLGGRGALGGNVTINAGGKLEFDISTSDALHDPLNLQTGKDLVFSGASTLTITSSGGASSGQYTLVTGGNAIGFTSLPTLVLPVGWSATASISGSSLLLDVTTTGSIYTVGYDSNGATSGTAPSAQTKNHDVSLVLQSNSGNLTRTGYTFAGWNTQADGLGSDYAEGASYTANAGVTLYAKWNAMPYTAWSIGPFAGTFTETALTSNPDGDSLTNLQEFAYGMDPTSPFIRPLSYAQGSAAPGIPIIENAGTPQSPNYQAVFVRRKDHVTAGLSYTVEFSANMSYWVPSAEQPSPCGEINSSVDAVAVPFPLTVPISDSVGSAEAPPLFFRVGVQSD